MGMRFLLASFLLEGFGQLNAALLTTNNGKLQIWMILNLTYVS